MVPPVGTRVPAKLQAHQHNTHTLQPETLTILSRQPVPTSAAGHEACGNCLAPLGTRNQEHTADGHPGNAPSGVEMKDSTCEKEKGIHFTNPTPPRPSLYVHHPLVPPVIAQDLPSTTRRFASPCTRDTSAVAFPASACFLPQTKGRGDTPPTSHPNACWTQKPGPGPCLATAAHLHYDVPSPNTGPQGRRPPALTSKATSAGRKAISPRVRPLRAGWEMGWGFPQPRALTPPSSARELKPHAQDTQWPPATIGKATKPDTLAGEAGRSTKQGPQPLHNRHDTLPAKQGYRLLIHMHEGLW